ncbi:hypothetical protein ACFV1N_25600 [Streptosporangium canum]|uniref:hypothetical protein n=1 Tax=Streptosporangium canum TaxID=324952 RepID=UPI0036904850
MPVRLSDLFATPDAVNIITTPEGVRWATDNSVVLRLTGHVPLTILDELASLEDGGYHVRARKPPVCLETPCFPGAKFAAHLEWLDAQPYTHVYDSPWTYRVENLSRRPLMTKPYGDVITTLVDAHLWDSIQAALGPVRRSIYTQHLQFANGRGPIRLTVGHPDDAGSYLLGFLATVLVAAKMTVPVLPNLDGTGRCIGDVHVGV